MQFLGVGALRGGGPDACWLCVCLLVSCDKVTVCLQGAPRKVTPISLGRTVEYRQDVLP